MLWHVLDQKTIMDKPELQHHSCTRTQQDSMGISCYHTLKTRIRAGEVIYLHDFHSRWFFEEPSDSLIQAAPRPILNPSVVQTRGRLAAKNKRQPISST